MTTQKEIHGKLLEAFGRAKSTVARDPESILQAARAAVALHDEESAEYLLSVIANYATGQEFYNGQAPIGDYAKIAEAFELLIHVPPKADFAFMLFPD